MSSRLCYCYIKKLVALALVRGVVELSVKKKTINKNKINDNDIKSHNNMMPIIILNNNNNNKYIIIIEIILNYDVILLWQISYWPESWWLSSSQ